MRKHSHTFIKRLAIVFGAIVTVFGLSGCTKSFCTNQDKANQLYASYGNIFTDSINVSADDVDAGVSAEEITKQNTNRTTLYSTLASNGINSLPDKSFQAFMNNKVTTFVDDNYTMWTDGTLADLETSKAKIVAEHVGIYSGITADDSGNKKVGVLWTNFDIWYEEALTDSSVGVLKAPSSQFVTLFKSTIEKTIASNTACISPVSEEFTQGGSTIYIEGKTWGQAFHDYGFLEGLFVYPFAYIIHVISENFGDTGWAQILAIVVVTLLARIITVISSIFQSRSQAKQQKIQPMINALNAKYPNATYDKEQKNALAMEQATLMKKAKVHPLLPMLFMIIQFPLFICVWSALQGSAALASGNWLGLSLTTTVSTCFTSYSSTPGAIVGICIFIFMTIANVLSSLTGLWLNNWRTKNFGSPTAQPKKDDNGAAIDPNKSMKWMTYIMMFFVVIMGWSLPAAMGIYWFLGAVIAIAQTILTEAITTHTRHKMQAETGDGSDLAAIRRSSHHNASDKKDKKSKSDKPLWRQLIYEQVRRKN